MCQVFSRLQVLFSHPLCLADGVCPDDNDSNDYLSIDETVMSISYLHELESLVCCTKAGSILIYNFVTHAVLTLYIDLDVEHSSMYHACASYCLIKHIHNTT